MFNNQSSNAGGPLADIVYFLALIGLGTILGIGIVIGMSFA